MDVEWFELGVEFFVFGISRFFFWGGIFVFEVGELLVDVEELGVVICEFFEGKEIIIELFCWLCCLDKVGCCVFERIFLFIFGFMLIFWFSIMLERYCLLVRFCGIFFVGILWILEVERVGIVVVLVKVGNCGLEIIIVEIWFDFGLFVFVKLYSLLVRGLLDWLDFYCVECVLIVFELSVDGRDIICELGLFMFIGFLIIVVLFSW